MRVEQKVFLTIYNARLTAKFGLDPYTRKQDVGCSGGNLRAGNTIGGLTARYLQIQPTILYADILRDKRVVVVSIRIVYRVENRIVASTQTLWQCGSCKLIHRIMCKVANTRNIIGSRWVWIVGGTSTKC